MSFRKITVKSGNEESTLEVTEEEYLKYYRPWWWQKKHDQMCNMVPTTQASGGTFELHISNDKDGKAIGSMCGADYSLMVYQPKDFDPANPVYKVMVWDKGGNVTERMVAVSKVDTAGSD